MSFSITPVLASKLGITSDSAKKKADELIRLAELKMKSSSLSSLNLSSTSIAVMCVDLASTASSLHLDKTMAIKLSGLTKKSYTTAIKILQQMLNMKQDMSISNLSIQFGCSEAKQLAINIFKSYQDSQQNLDLNEMNVGLFNCASLYTSCRKLKIKVDRRKMISYVGVQASVFNRLVEQMDPIATNIMRIKDGISNGSDDFSKSITQDIEEKSNGKVDMGSKNEGKAARTNHEETSEEPFHVWKERILRKAREALNAEKT